MLEATVHPSRQLHSAPHNPIDTVCTHVYTGDDILTLDPEARLARPRALSKRRARGTGRQGEADRVVRNAVVAEDCRVGADCAHRPATLLEGSHLGVGQEHRAVL